MNTLEGIAMKFHKETGEHMIIGVGFTKDGSGVHGSVNSPDIPFESACVMLTEITALTLDNLNHGDLDEEPE